MNTVLQSYAGAAGAAQSTWQSGSTQTSSSASSGTSQSANSSSSSSSSSSVAASKSASASKSAATAASARAKTSKDYGRTVGEPKLSDQAKAYYDKLKAKFSGMDFILVSRDMKDIAKSMAGSYANPNRMVVLIDEDKIERMATDEKFRKQYEAIISNAPAQMQMARQALAKSPAGSAVKTIGIQVDSKGLTSMFAVVDKSLAAQRTRMAKKAEQKRADKKKAKKEAEKERLEKRLEERRANGKKSKETDTDDEIITADSLEDLLKKLEELVYSDMSNWLRTEEEMQRGQHIDFRG